MRGGTEGTGPILSWNSLDRGCFEAFVIEVLAKCAFVIEYHGAVGGGIKRFPIGESRVARIA